MQGPGNGPSTGSESYQANSLFVATGFRFVLETARGFYRLSRKAVAQGGSGLLDSMGDLYPMFRSNKLLGALGAAGLALGAVSGSAAADDKFGYSWTITGASDYLFRGISFTQSDPTINSYLELNYDTGGLLGTAYLAFWTSNIDIPGYAGPVEQDIYLGIRPTTGPISWDLAAMWYIYAAKGAFDWDDIDYFEFKAAASWSPITNWTLAGAVYYSPDQDLASPENVSVEGGIAYTLPQFGIFTPTVGGQVGFTSASNNSIYSDAVGGGFWNGVQDYTYWNAGVKLAVEKWTFDLRYWDTSIDRDEALTYSNSDDRFFFSAAITLP